MNLTLLASLLPSPSPHRLRTSLVGLCAFLHLPTIICFLFISCAGLVTFGHHPRETRSVLACVFLPPKIPESLLELEQDPCRVLGVSVTCDQTSDLALGLGGSWAIFSLCASVCFCCVKQSPVDLEVPSLHPLATKLFWTPGLGWTKFSFFMRRWRKAGRNKCPCSCPGS